MNPTRFQLIKCMICICVSLIFTSAFGLTEPQVVAPGYKEAPYKFNLYVSLDSNGPQIGSSFAVTPRVAVTAAHIVFDDSTLSFRPSLGLSPGNQAYHDSYTFLGNRNYSINTLTAYAARSEEDGPGNTSSYEAFNRDLATLSHSNPFLALVWDIQYSDSTSNHPLIGSTTKTILGFPADTAFIQYGDRQKLHQTNLGTRSFEAYSTEDDGHGNSWSLYHIDNVHAIGGNSGGPITIDDPVKGVVPAGILVGGSDTLALAKGFDSEVMSLINNADIAGGGSGLDGYLEPVFLIQPQKQGFNHWHSIELDAVATQTANTPSYQWYKDDIPLAGATYFRFNVDEPTINDAGTYYLIVTNEHGFTKSDEVEVYQFPAPEITTSFEDVLLGNGSRFKIEAKAESEIQIEYQWFHDGIAWNSKSYYPYLDLNVSPDSTGEWWVVASNDSGSTESDHFQISVFDFNRSFERIGATLGEEFTLEAPLNDPDDVFSYDWYYNEKQEGIKTKVQQQYTGTFHLNEFLELHVGFYELKVTAPSGSFIVSNEFEIFLEKPVYFTNDYGDYTLKIAIGGSASFSTYAAGDFRPFRYQWFRNGDIIAGETSKEISLHQITSQDVGIYHQTITDSQGYTITSRPKTLELSPGMIGPFTLDIGLVASENPLDEIAKYAKGVSADEAVLYPENLYVLGDLVYYGQEVDISTIWSTLKFTSSNGKLSVLKKDGTLSFYPAPTGNTHFTTVKNAVDVASTDSGPILLTTNRKCFLWNIETNTDITPPGILQDQELVAIKAYSNLLWATDISGKLWQWNIITDEVSSPAGNSPVMDFSLRSGNKAILLKDGQILQLGYQYKTENDGVFVEMNDPIPTFTATPIEIDVTDNFTLVRMDNGESAIWGKIPLPQGSLLGNEGDLYSIPSYQFHCDYINAGSRYIQLVKNRWDEHVHITSESNHLGDTVVLWATNQKKRQEYTWYQNHIQRTTTEHPFLELKKAKPSDMGIYYLEDSQSVYLYLEDQVFIQGEPMDIKICPDYLRIDLSIYASEPYHVNWYKDGEFFEQFPYWIFDRQFAIGDTGIYQAEVVSENGYTLGWSKSFSITVNELEDYSTWSESHQLGNFSTSHTRDSDLDGMPDLMEYMLRTNPNRYDQPETRYRIQDACITLEVARDFTHEDSGDYELVLYTSSDLISWEKHEFHKSLGNGSSSFNFPAAENGRIFYKLVLEEE